VAEAVREENAEPVTNHYLVDQTPPQGVPPVPLSKRQIQAAERELQRAAAVVHARTQRLATTQETGAVIFAVVGVISAATGYFQSSVAIAGFLWFLVSAFVIGHFARASTDEAAEIQEVLDCRLFYLDWNDTLGSADRVTHERMLRLSNKLKAGSEAESRIDNGWYDPTDGVEYPYDVLIAQEQNVCWDVRLRKRFAWALAILGTGWTVLGLVVGLSGASVSKTLLVVFVPAAAAYDLGRERWRVQRQTSRERQRLAQIVGGVLDQAQSGPVSDQKREDLTCLARSLQDGIYRTRSEFGRVPGVLYKWFQPRDEHEFAQISENRRRKLTE
jgi:hypothetical protein